MHWAPFDTPVGRCAVAWGPRGIVALQMPEKSEAQQRNKLLLRAPGATLKEPPAHIQAVLDDLVALLRGEVPDLSNVELDLTGIAPFAARVYAEARRIAPGMTMSYGEMAERIGSPGSSRAVGNALGKNPFAILVPCHRVLSSDGRIGGFSFNGGVVTKMRMLAIEAPCSPHFEGDGTLGFEPALALAHLRKVDADLGKMIDRIGPYTMRLKRTSSIFVALAESIVYQQLSGRAAATIWARVRALFPHGHVGPLPEQVLRASDKALRGAGLSQNKMLALRDLARRASDGSIPTLAEAQSMDDEALVEKLVSVRGIGRWTVEMLLMFRLGRADLLPVDDLGIAKGIRRTYRMKKMPTREKMRALGERWRPYRSVASWYFWRIADLG